IVLKVAGLPGAAGPLFFALLVGFFNLCNGFFSKATLHIGVGFFYAIETHQFAQRPHKDGSFLHRIHHCFIGWRDFGPWHRCSPLYMIRHLIDKNYISAYGHAGSSEPGGSLTAREADARSLPEAFFVACLTPPSTLS